VLQGCYKGVTDRDQGTWGGCGDGGDDDGGSGGNDDDGVESIVKSDDESKVTRLM
jgi:hypothetical protein